MSKQKL
jgi:hypothetical protein